MTVPEAVKSRKTDEPVKRPGVSPMGTKKPTGYGNRTVDLTMVLRAPVIINEERSSTVAPSPAGNEMKEKDSAGLMKAAPGESPSVTRAETHQAESEAPAEKKGEHDELASRVRDIITSVQGTLVSMENDEHGRLRLINATVAGNRLQDLHQRLESIAEMKPLPHSIVHSVQEEAPVKIIIRFEEKD